MKTPTMKFQSLAVLSVLMAFSLTSCDAVLESFYPEFAKGGKLASGSLTVDLNVDSKLSGNVIVALVPLSMVNGLKVPDPYTIVKSELIRLDSGHAIQSSFTLDPTREYKLVAYIADAQGYPNKDWEGSTQIFVNGKPIFQSSDVTGTVHGSLSGNSKAEQGLYFLFAKPGDTNTSNSAWIGQPPVVDLNSKLEFFSLQRMYPFDNSQLPAITSISYSLSLIGGATVSGDITGYDPHGVFIALAGTNITFTNGVYDLVVGYTIGNTSAEVTTTFIVGAPGGYQPYAPFQVQVEVRHWDSNYARGNVYYYDPSSHQVYPAGEVFNPGSGQTAEAPSVNLTYIPGAYFLVDLYDGGGNYQKSLFNPLNGPPGYYDYTTNALPSGSPPVELNLPSSYNSATVVHTSLTM